MTLILTCIHDSLILHVSDRRITLVHSNGTTTSRENPANKAVLFEGRVVFGFTGVAELEGEPTDMWIASHLTADSSVEEALFAMRDRLNAIFSQSPYKRHGHTIQAAGYREDGGQLTAFGAWVTNQVGPTSLSPRFMVRLEDAPPGTVLVEQAPSWLYPREMNQLRRLIRRGFQRHIGVMDALRFMAEAVWDVADRTPMVGRDLMLSVLPATAVTSPDADLWYSSGPPTPHRPSFLYVPGEGQQKTSYGPTLVAGGVVFHGIEAHYD